MARLTIVNPVALAQPNEETAERFPPAARPRSLDGARVGLFWNGKPQSDVALAAVQENLSRQFEKVTFVDVFGEKGGLNRYASAAQLDLMATTCDVVVGAAAD